MLHGRSAETARRGRRWACRGFAGLDDRAFPARQELWRLAAYLAIVAVAGNGPVGRQYLDRLAGAVRRYR